MDDGPTPRVRAVLCRQVSLSSQTPVESHVPIERHKVYLPSQPMWFWGTLLLFIYIIVIVIAWLCFLPFSQFPLQINIPVLMKTGIVIESGLPTAEKIG